MLRKLIYDILPILSTPSYLDHQQKQKKLPPETIWYDQTLAMLFMVS